MIDPMCGRGAPPRSGGDRLFTMAADDHPQTPSHDRAQAARAALVPLAPGERPWPIVVCALLAFALGSLTLVLYLADVTVDGSRPTLNVVVVYLCLMFGLGINVWRMRYWAVMAFQALLALAIFGFAIATIRVTDVLWLVDLPGGHRRRRARCSGSSSA